jgi:hypothetical protein
MTTRTNKIAFMAAVLLTVVTGTNMLEASAWNKFEKLRIAPVHRKMTAYRNPVYRPAVASTKYMTAQKLDKHRVSRIGPLAGTHTLIQQLLRSLSGRLETVTERRVLKNPLSSCTRTQGSSGAWYKQVIYQERFAQPAFLQTLLHRAIAGLKSFGRPTILAKRVPIA